MKTLYLECNMGAAGDMLMAALLELHPAPDDFVQRLNGVGIPGVSVTAQPSVKCGITGTHVKVTIHGYEEHDHHHEHAHEHHHNSYQEITHLIGHLHISDTVKKNALDVYQLLAQAESHVHGRPVAQIHFHEAGDMDAVADIVGVCMLMEELAPEQVLASPVNVGSGQVRCAHGILPVPAPATAHLLQNIPFYNNRINGELCTPTGAALLKHFVFAFEALPAMRVAQIGYGMGSKDFEAANCVRAFLGQTTEQTHRIAELSCNLDDMTPETIGFAQERLFEGGALDVFTIAAGMKKSRPGIILSCLCRLEDREKMLGLIFKHTTTLGIRETLCNRYTLSRMVEQVQTPHGPVRIKKAAGFGVCRQKAEYEDLAKIAWKKDLSMADVEKLI